MSNKTGVLPLRASSTGAGTVTSVAVATANGFAGTVATPTTTPTITLTTPLTGLLKANGSAMSAATAGTDYLSPPAGTSILKGNSGGALANAAAGTDYVAPSTTVNGHALSANVTVTATDVGLGNVTNNAQTQAAIVPNTAPAAGKILVGNAGGTAYAPVSLSSDATLASTGALTIANSAVTLAKIANAAASSKLLGSGASGSGAAYSELTLGTNLSMSGTTLNATSAAGGSMIFLSLVTAAAASTMDFDTTFDATYDSYMIQIPIVTLGSAGAFLDFRLKIGGTYQTGANYYSHEAIPSSSGAAYAATVRAAAATGRISSGFDADAASSMNLTIWVHNVTSTTKAKMIYWLGTESAATTPETRLLVGSGGYVGTNTALTGVRLMPDTGTITGTGRLYGIKNS